MNDCPFTGPFNIISCAYLEDGDVTACLIPLETGTPGVFNKFQRRDAEM